MSHRHYNLLKNCGFSNIDASGNCEEGPQVLYSNLMRMVAEKIAELPNSHLEASMELSSSWTRLISFDSPLKIN